MYTILFRFFFFVFNFFIHTIVLFYFFLILFLCLINIRISLKWGMFKFLFCSFLLIFMFDKKRFEMFQKIRFCIYKFKLPIATPDIFVSHYNNTKNAFYWLLNHNVLFQHYVLRVCIAFWIIPLFCTNCNKIIWFTVINMHICWNLLIFVFTLIYKLIE